MRHLSLLVGNFLKPYLVLLALQVKSKGTFFERVDPWDLVANWPDPEIGLISLRET